MDIRDEKLDYLCSRITECFNDTWVTELGVSEGKNKVFDYWMHQTDTCVHCALVYKYQGNTELITRLSYDIERGIDVKSIVDSFYRCILKTIMFNTDREYDSLGQTKYIKSMATLYKE